MIVRRGWCRDTCNRCGLEIWWSHLRGRWVSHDDAWRGGLCSPERT